MKYQKESKNNISIKTMSENKILRNNNQGDKPSLHTEKLYNNDKCKT